MAKTNFERMIDLVNEVFDTKNDPGQISVTPEDRAKLEQIHEYTLNEVDYGDGPVMWLLLIPTTTGHMNRFVSTEISEQQLLDLTPIGEKYDALYLCSATSLPEYRGKGLAKQVCLDAIAHIRADHPIASLFVWPFSKDGDGLASALAKTLDLPLLKRKD
jgi:ribosomal protein S18 acetylase RimI-like enzyme